VAEPILTFENSLTNFTHLWAELALEIECPICPEVTWQTAVFSGKQMWEIYSHCFREGMELLSLLDMWIQLD
jgi:hypothetical protein